MNLPDRIATAAATTPAEPTRWGWYSAVAAAVGCCSQSVYLWSRRTGTPARVRLPDDCRACGRPLVGGVHGHCRACCVQWGGSWR